MDGCGEGEGLRAAKYMYEYYIIIYLLEVTFDCLAFLCCNDGSLLYAEILIGSGQLHCQHITNAIATPCDLA